MGAPKLKPGTLMQQRTAGDEKELRTLDRGPGEKPRPRSMWHRARWWLHHHLSREDSGEWEDTTGWGRQRSTVARRSRRSGLSREQLREDVRAGQHAQELRAEAATVGGKEERARFYGTGEFGASGGGEERRITVADAERQREQHELEEAHRWAGRRRRQPVRAEFRLPWEID